MGFANGEELDGKKICLARGPGIDVCDNGIDGCNSEVEVIKIQWASEGMMGIGIEWWRKILLTHCFKGIMLM